MFLRSACSIGLVLVLAAAAQQRPVAAPAAPAAQAEFAISGTLVDAVTGQPVAHARVAIAPVSQRDNFSTMVTAEDGRFSFLNLAPGKYTLTAQARGYLLQSFNQHDQYSSSIVVGPALDSTGLLFRLPPESSISGVISDEAGEPVRDAQVMLYQTGVSFGSEGTRLRNRATTNDEGSYRFGHLPPGRYLIAVEAKPWYAQHPLPRPEAAVASGGSGTGSGTISDRISSTVSGTISLQIARAYGFQNEPGSPPLDVAYPIAFYPGVTEAGAATPIVLGRGERVTANLNLQPVPALRVIVNMEETEPGKASFLTLQQRVLDGPPVQVRTETRRTGPKTMEIVGIPAGHYTLRDYVAGGGVPAEWSDVREIDVASSGELGASQGRQYVPVTATFRLDSGKLPAPAFLQLVGKKTRKGFGERVGSAGEIKFKQGVPPGAYEVSLGGAPGLYIKSISAPGASVVGRTLEVRSAPSLKLTIAVAHGEAVVTGTALREGKPLAGAMIVLVPADPAHNQVLFRRDQSDTDGTFKLSEVVPAKYTVLAIENGWDLEWTNADVLKNYMAQGVAVQALQNGKYDVKVTVQ